MKFAEWKEKIVLHKIGLLILLFASILLLINVHKRTFWMDETAVLEYVHQSPVDFIIAYVQYPDNHPPLYYFLVVLVSKLLPLTELTIRLVSIVAAVSMVWLVYKFALALWSEKKYAYLASFLTVCSSYFVLIGQMARYHSLAACLSLGALYMFYRLTHGEYSRTNIVKYILFSVGVCVTDYPHFIYLLVITSVYLLYLMMRKKIKQKLAWIGIQFVVLLSFVPMIWLLLHRIFVQGDGGFEKINLLHNSVMHIFAAIAFHVYVFLFGENIFPWNWAVVIAGIVVLVYTVALLIMAIKKKHISSGHGWIVGVCILYIVINTLFLNIVNPRYNFIVYPKYVFVAYPLFVLALVGCLRYASQRMRTIAVITWVLISVYGLYNFYSLRNYINASYFNTFAQYEFVELHMQKGDQVVLNGDYSKGVYRMYAQTYFRDLILLKEKDLSNVEQSGRVWFFSTGSDALSVSETAESKIPDGYRILKNFNSVPLDPMLIHYKQKLLGNSSYIYKYSVFLLEKI